MFREKGILKKLLLVASIPLIIFAIISGVWYFKYGVLNQKYTLDGMKREKSWDNRQTWITERDYATFQIYKQSFLKSLEYMPYLEFTPNQRFYNEFFPEVEEEIEVNGYLVTTRFQMKIMLNESIESGFRFIVTVNWSNKERDRMSLFEFCVDAEGNPVREEEWAYYRPEDVGLIKKYCQQQKEVFRKGIEVAAQNWGQGILE